MRSKRICAAILAFIMLILSGCVSLAEKLYPETEPETTRTAFIPVDVEEGRVFFRDFDGNELTLEKEPDSVISLSPVATEIICGIGAARYISALDEISATVEDAPISAEVLPYFYADVNRIEELSPDIVFYSDSSSDMITVMTLRTKGITMIRIPDRGGISAAEANIRFISELLFKEEIGAKTIASMREEFEKTRLTAELIGLSKTVYIEGPTKFTAYCSGSIISELCAFAGADNIFPGTGVTKLTSAAEVNGKDPQLVIVLTNDPDSFDIDTVRKREGIDQIYASRTKSIFAVDFTSATRPTQNIVKALREVEQIMKMAK